MSASPVLSWALGPMAIHEAAHVVTAALLGCAVHSASVHAHGGQTYAVGSARERLLIALAGHEGERLILGRADARVSRGDFHAAFASALGLARGEGRARPADPAGGMPVPSGRAFSRALSAFSAADIEKGVERVASRWTARAGVLVSEAEVEASRLLAAHLCVVRVIAAALSERGSLRGEHVAALFREGMEKQEEHDRRSGGLIRRNA